MPKESSNNTAEKTRRRIVKATEKLFAEKGFRGMTLRDVTKEADVNLAAVNYHFGSKSKLMHAVVEDRFSPINQERLRRLDLLVEAHTPVTVPVDEIFGALFRPLFEQAVAKKNSGKTLGRLIGRAMNEPADFMRGIIKEFFADLCERFIAELIRSCPEMPEETVRMRFFLAVSTMLGTITEQTRFEDLLERELDAAAFDKICDELIAFAVAGFQQN